MADFCKQCNLELFDLNESDFGPYEEIQETGVGYIVLCESCGPTIVDHNGICVNPKCEIHGENSSGIKQ